jgi:hypothetical protein
MTLKDIYGKREERILYPYIEARQQFNRKIQYRVCAVTYENSVPLTLSQWDTFAPAKKLMESVKSQVDTEHRAEIKQWQAEREARSFLNHTTEPRLEEFS